MVRRSNRSSSVLSSVLLTAAVAAAASFAPSARASTYYWDGNGAAAGSGTNAQVAGTWETSQDWTASSTGSTATAYYNTVTDGSTTGTAGNDVVFVASDGVAADNPTGAYTVTLSANETVNSLSIGQGTATGTTATNYTAGTPTFAGSGGAILTIGAGGLNDYGTAADFTLANTLSIVLGADQTWSVANPYAHVYTLNSAVAGNATLGNTRTWTLGYVSAYTPTIAGVISDGTAGGSLALVVNSTNSGNGTMGSGTYTITGTNNSYTGCTTIARGNVTIASLANAGLASSLGAPTVANGTINLGNGTYVGCLTFASGTNSTSNRTINLAGTTANAGIYSNNNGGALALTGGITATGLGAKTLTLGGSSTANNSVSGGISDSSGGATSLSKTGTSLWTLVGPTTYTGGTTIACGTLALTANATLGGNVAGNNISIAGGNLILGASTNIGTNQSLSVTSAGGGIGVAADPTSFPAVTVASGAQLVYGLNYQGLGGITGPGAQAGVQTLFNGTSYTTFLGSFTSGNYTGSSLPIGPGNTYRLGGGGGTLIIANSILTDSGGTNLIVGTTTSGGNLTLPGANTYSGNTTIQNGIVTASVIGSYGPSPTPSSFGAPSTAAAGTLTFGLTTQATGLNYTGAGETTNRPLTFLSTTGNITFTNAGTGNVVFSSTAAFTGTGNKTVLLGTTSDTYGGTLGGVVNGNGAANQTSVLKNGLTDSTWNLPNANYTGTTTINGGVLSVPTSELTATKSVTVTGNSPTQLAVLQSSGTYAPTIGTTLTLGQDAGFAAQGGKLTVSITTAATIPNQLLWNGTGSNFGGSGGAPLVFGSSTADSQVELTNPINLNTTDQYNHVIYVDKGVGGDSALLSGVISGGNTTGAASGIDLQGAGTLILSNAANSYSGQTLISGGTLIAAGNAPTGGAAGVLGTGAGSIAAPATTYYPILLGDGNTVSNNWSPSLLIGGAYTIARPITINNDATTGKYSIGGSTDNNATFSGAISAAQSFTVNQVANTGGNALAVSGNITSTTNSNKTITFANAGNVNDSGSIAEGGGGHFALVQSGAGSTTLSGANTYTLGTTLNAGTLIAADTTLSLTASSTGTGNVTVNGGTLASAAGTASYILGSVLGGSGSHTIAPGTAGSLGTLVVGGLAPNAATTFVMDITNSGTPLVGDASDNISSNTPFNYNGTLVINSLVATSDYAIGDAWNLFTGVGSDPAFQDNALFGTGGDGTDLPILPAGEVWNFSYTTGTLSIGAGVSAVPEPASLALLAVAGVGLIARRKRR